jgi:3',5'-cyclic AMP phosphodiesterase CpdA
MIIAQISDMHVEAADHRPAHGIDVNAGLAAALQRIEAHRPRPDLVLATGDLTADGEAAEYEALAELLAATTLPVYLLPGNHDDRARMRLLPGHDYLPAGNYLHYVIDDYPLRVVVLDTLDPASPHGNMCPSRCDWLAAQLATEPARPTIVAMHHPPADIGIGWLNSGQFTGRDSVRDIIAAHHQVQGILCGHVHRCAQLPLAHTRIHTAGSTAYQFPLELGEDAPRGKTDEPPTYSLHYWQPETGLISHAGYVGL